MRIDKAQVVFVLVARGDHATAAQADKSLPSSMDPEKDAEFLHRFGVDPRELVRSLARQGQSATDDAEPA